MLCEIYKIFSQFGSCQSPPHSLHEIAFDKAYKRGSASYRADIFQKKVFSCLQHPQLIQIGGSMDVVTTMQARWHPLVFPCIDISKKPLTSIKSMLSSVLRRYQMPLIF